MKLIYKFLAVMALLVSISSCEVQRWEDVPVDYTDVFYFKPTSDAVTEYGYTIYPETSVLVTWDSEFFIGSYNDIYDYVDSSDENGYYVTFREIRYEDYEGNVPGYGEDVDTSEFTIQKSYYYVIDTDIYGRGTYSITDEDGITTTEYMLMELDQKTLEK